MTDPRTKHEGLELMPRVVASIEARMGSSRLPGKVLHDINGQPALTRLLRRLRKCRHVNDIVLATTTSPLDDALEDWSRQERVACYRGSEEDVLNRVVQAHRSLGSDVIVEITGDCTLLDPQIIDMGVATFLANSCDVVTNVKYPSYPMGIDVQVFPLRLLKEVERTITEAAVREHVSLYFYQNPTQYNIIHLKAPPMWHHPAYRFQLDYEEDRQFINEVYRRLEPTFGDGFGMVEILSLLRRQPWLLKLNAHCEEKAVA